MTLMIATTISSSMRVKPCSLPAFIIVLLEKCEVRSAAAIYRPPRSAATRARIYGAIWVPVWACTAEQCRKLLAFEGLNGSLCQLVWRAPTHPGGSSTPQFNRNHTLRSDAVV